MYFLSKLHNPKNNLLQSGLISSVSFVRFSDDNLVASDDRYNALVVLPTYVAYEKTAIRARKKKLVAMPTTADSVGQ